MPKRLELYQDQLPSLVLSAVASPLQGRSRWDPPIYTQYHLNVHSDVPSYSPVSVLVGAEVEPKSSTNPRKFKLGFTKLQ